MLYYTILSVHVEEEEEEWGGAQLIFDQRI